MNTKTKPSLVYAGGSYYEDVSDPVSLVHVVYILDADSLEIRDSIVLDAWPQRISSSSDGHILFLEVYDDNTNSQYVRAVEAPSSGTRWSYPNASLLAVVESGKSVAVGTDSHSTVILSSEDGRVVRSFADTLQFFRGEYSGVELVAWVHSGNDRSLKIINSETGAAKGRYHPRLITGDALDVRFALLHQDGHRVLSIGRRSQNADSWFVIGDVDTDSTLLEYRIVYSNGEIAISDDGCWAAVTDPSSPFHDSYRTLDIFDTSRMIHLHRFVEPEVYSPGQSRFLSDRPVLASFPLPGNVGPLQTIDLTTLKITISKWFPGGDTMRTQGFMYGPFDTAPLP